jgi:hypothetical protein
LTTHARCVLRIHPAAANGLHRIPGIYFDFWLDVVKSSAEHAERAEKAGT